MAKQNDVVQRIAKVIEINDLLQNNDHLVIAVSGGPDSLALLHIMGQLHLNLTLIAVYVDHGLRPDEIKGEKDRIHTYCKQHKILFISRSVAVTEYATKQKKSTEDAARLLRYDALQDICENHSARGIATGHTSDDQVEEFFIRLIRGSGARGLSGMRTRRDNIFRPLLGETKQTLIDYLAENSIAWCTDSSNVERKFLRNRIRLDLIPLLKEKFNPAIHKIVRQCMDILHHEDDYLEQITSERFGEVVSINNKKQGSSHRSREIVIQGGKFSTEHLAIQRRILEKCFWEIDSRPTHRHIFDILQLIDHSDNGSELHFSRNLRAEKRSGDIYLFHTSVTSRSDRDRVTPKQSVDLWIKHPGKYIITEYGKTLDVTLTTMDEFRREKNENILYLDANRITFPLQLRSVAPGDTFHPFNGPGTKKVARFFTDRKIPKQVRKTTPLLLSGDKIIAVVGLQLADQYKISPETEHVLALEWTPDSVRREM